MILQALASFKKGKAPAPDSTPIDFIKLLDANNLRILLQAINEAYSKGKPQASWKVAKIMCIFKKGDSSLPENYRPISLLDVVYKLYAKLIRKRMQQQVDKRLRKTQ